MPRKANGRKYVESRYQAATRWRKKNPAKRLIWWARARAAALNVPFDITADDILIPSHCPILGIPLCLTSDRKIDESPSLDRVIPELGYVKGNVVVISWRANNLKSNGHLDEFVRLVDWLRLRNFYK